MLHLVLHRPAEMVADVRECRNERRPESAYSLSKLMGETMAEQYTRWDPSLKIISMRFSNVMLPEEYAGFEKWQVGLLKYVTRLMGEC